MKDNPQIVGISLDRKVFEERGLDILMDDFWVRHYHENAGLQKALAIAIKDAYNKGLYYVDKK